MRVMTWSKDPSTIRTPFNPECVPYYLDCSELSISREKKCTETYLIRTYLQHFIDKTQGEIKRQDINTGNHTYLQASTKI